MTMTVKKDDLCVDDFLQVWLPQLDKLPVIVDPRLEVSGRLYLYSVASWAHYVVGLPVVPLFALSGDGLKQQDEWIKRCTSFKRPRG
ncbi:MAG: hypothetical protein IJ679_08290 [Lachnospiraceae bacterium]|nr:hypothetical protein [Lachnospiraceae bacterium]